jgi:hypothetical protein
VLGCVTPGADSATGTTVPQVGVVLTMPSCLVQTLAPATLTLACADANYTLVKLHWANWGSDPASIDGQASVNDCTPNCAAGHFHSYQVTAMASGIEHCLSGRMQYTKLVVHYTGARPTGIAANDSYSFPCDPVTPGPKIKAVAEGHDKVSITGTGWVISKTERCSTWATVYNNAVKPSLFLQPKIQKSGDFHVVWTAPHTGRAIVVANQGCGTSAAGVQVYESAVRVTVR